MHASVLLTPSLLQDLELVTPRLWRVWIGQTPSNHMFDESINKVSVMLALVGTRASQGAQSAYLLYCVETHSKDIQAFGHKQKTHEETTRVRNWYFWTMGHTPCLKNLCQVKNLCTNRTYFVHSYTYTIFSMVGHACPWRSFISNGATLLPASTLFTPFPDSEQRTK